LPYLPETITLRYPYLRAPLSLLALRALTMVKLHDSIRRKEGFKL
jgi:hypothetical protein